MLKEGNYSMTWYAGSEEFPAQTIFADLFREVIDTGKFERVVFYGGSGGGFASLYYSSLVTGSIAVAAVPQTSMHRYNPVHIKRYMDGCWPSLKSAEELTERICTDLCAWYSVARPNTVIYQQSASDHTHTRNQLAPFLSEISRAPKSRFIVNSDYWGKLGHSGSVPVSASKPWLRAAFLSSTIEVDELLQTYHSLKGSTEKAHVAAANRETHTASYDEHHLADLLRDYHFRQSLKD